MAKFEMALVLFVGRNGKWCRKYGCCLLRQSLVCGEKIFKSKLLYSKLYLNL